MVVISIVFGLIGAFMLAFSVIFINDPDRPKDRQKLKQMIQFAREGKHIHSFTYMRKWAFRGGLGFIFLSYLILLLVEVGLI